ncbi:MAG: twin transmembrane helix small protein [Sinobacteraceae bacterium]|nr:twin transmembrane helix small protein [Nevskiaceae bacterium]
MIVKLIILAFLVAIVVSLFSGFFFLLHDDSTRDNRRTLHALQVRVGLSIAFIAFIVLSYLMGWLHPHPPHAAPPGNTAAQQHTPPHNNTADGNPPSAVDNPH